MKRNYYSRATRRTAAKLQWTGLWLGVALLLAALPNSLAGRSQNDRVRVEPKEINDLFANPGMGWETFQRCADEDKNLAGLPSACAYFRFYWREIEPKDGRIDFALFDRLLAHAHRDGQKLAFRIMCTGSSRYMDVPQWLKEEGCKGVEFNYGGRRHWVPDFTDPLFQRAHFRLIRRLGRRYDGNPNLDLVDIGSVGLWGEWHMSGTEEIDTGKPAPLPPLEVRMKIIRAWCEAFPQASKVVQIGSTEGMANAAALACGWRADCLGDMGGFSKTWNHMDNFYMQQLARTGAREVWKTGPVAFESCWDMRKWKAEGWNIRYIFDYALRCHASYLNNKSAPIPGGTRPEIERFLRHLGYRLVVRSVEHARVAHPGEDFIVKTTWENIGVAPPYRDYRVALRLMNTTNAEAKPLVSETENSIRGWLPGTRTTQSVVKLPGSFAAGRYALELGLVDPESNKPAVRLAIAGRGPEGWYPVSRVDVVPDK